MSRSAQPPPAPVASTTLLDEALIRARHLLHANLTPHGISAAAGRDRNYHCIFGRDASICSLAMARANDDTLRDGAERALRTLARHQAANGQIPKFVDTENDKGDFWYVGCIDATLWWLVAVDCMERHGGRALRTELREPVDRAIHWLQCQEHPRLHLIQQNEASDWADIMPRSGFVLYSNALWYHVKQLYSLPDVESTHHHFNHLFHPFSRDLPDYRRLRLLTHYVKQKARHRDLYLSFVNFSYFGDEGDVFGNLLAILFGLADSTQSRRILRSLDRDAVTEPYPIRTVCDPIRRSDPLWRSYMSRHRQNLEYQYHNGGCWPFVAGFHVLALAATGRVRDAQRALVNVAQANAMNDWKFYEWFHGRTGKPAGMTGQSWNAAMLLLAHHGLTSRVF